MAKHVRRVLFAATCAALVVSGEPKRAVAESPAAACQRKHPNVTLAAVGSPAGSTVLLGRWAGTTTALVADEDDGVLRAIEPDSGVVRSATPLGGTPAQLAILADGRVVVTLRDKSQLQIFEPTADARTPLGPLCAIDVADEPVGLALTANGSRLLVTSGYGHALTTIDTKTMAPVAVTSLARDPRAVIVDDDGKRAFVSHMVGGKLSIVDLASTGKAEHNLKEVPLDPKKKLSFGSGPIEQKAVQGFALAKSVRIPGRGDLEAELGQNEPRVYLPLAVADPGEPQARPSGYGSGRPGPAEVPFVAVVDPKNEKPVVSEIKGEDLHRSRECMLPRAARFVARSRSLLVACMGIDMLVELDANESEPSRKERARWRVGAGPTGFAVDADERRAIVWSQFDHVLTVVTLEGKTAPKKLDVARSKPIAPQLALGRVLFHKSDDPRLSRDGRACASCHPDGREDALTWSTPSGPRQTIMLAGRTTGAAPFSWSGTNPTIEEHVTGTFLRLGGKGMAKDDPDLAALLQYVASMKPPSPRARTEMMVGRGREIFFGKQQACVTCHIGGTGTDGKTHEVGAKGDGAFDTPSLRFVRGTAPYFHDGRYPTLDALLSATDHRMGLPRDMSESDRRALIAYLETL